jgi:hypothetical protein
MRRSTTGETRERMLEGMAIAYKDGHRGNGKRDRGLNYRTANKSNGFVRSRGESQTCHEISKCKIGFGGGNDQVEKDVVWLISDQCW